MKLASLSSLLVIPIPLVQCYHCNHHHHLNHHHHYYHHPLHKNKFKSLSLSSLSSLLEISSLSSLSSLVPIPVEISSIDTITSTTSNTITSIPSNIPNTSIQTLDGGDNLGTLLWSYIMYNGITTNGKPADWYLPIISKVFNTYNEEWYKDYTDGYAFEVPILVEVVRVTTFLALGYYINLAIINSFDYDNFWGWSIGICLSIPSALLNASREKPISRTLGQLQDRCVSDFNDFASSRLTRSDSKGATVSESSLINSFRRSYAAYRYSVGIDFDGDTTFDSINNNNNIDDKFLKKVIRNYVGYKPIDGVYKVILIIILILLLILIPLLLLLLLLQNLILLNTKKDALDENKRLVANANKMRQEFLRSSIINTNANDDNNDSDTTTTTTTN